jgi:hypothetical protein
MNAPRRNGQAILSEPIRAYKFKEHDRDRLVNDALVERVNTAFALHGIPVYDPDRWERLSWSLLCSVFPEGFAILEKPRGGDKKNPEDLYAVCAEKFEAFFSTSRYPSRTAGALAYLKKNGGSVRVGDESISTNKGLLRAVGRGNAERQRQLNETALIRYAMRRALAGNWNSPLQGN